MRSYFLNYNINFDKRLLLFWMCYLFKDAYMDSTREIYWIWTYYVHSLSVKKMHARFYYLQVNPLTNGSHDNIPPAILLVMSHSADYRGSLTAQVRCGHAHIGRNTNQHAYEFSCPSSTTIIKLHSYIVMISTEDLYFSMLLCSM